MSLWGYIIIGVVDFLIISAAIMFIITYIITDEVFGNLLVRSSPKKAGAHFHLRINAEEKYDAEIKKFVDETTAL